ncbi:Gfo/Idh/MocA family oxidoreductase [Pseudomonadales bacterium]|nr:Gfo/Idh/MocA family oxidoreductase [Pseudomonadales bacterium]
MIERVLIVGYGSIGKRHLSIVRETLPNADIRILRHLPQFDVPKLANGSFDSLQVACDFKPNVSIIANPAPFHIEVANALASVGSHILMEKPISANAVGVKSLINLMRSKALVLQIGYNLRFLPSLAWYRNHVLAGGLGDILSVRCEFGQYLPSWRPDTDYRQGVSARRDLGGGVMLELSHELDYLRWIFGEVEWVSAWLGHQSDLQIDVEDTAHLTLGFCNSGNSVGRLSLDFIRHDTSRTCTAIGSRGSCRWNGLTGEVEEWLEGGNGWQSVFRHLHHRNESYQNQWQHFVSCVDQHVDPLISGEDGLAVLEIILAARQSAGANGVRALVGKLEKLSLK